jgi:uncharacterized membrane protein YczE
LVFSFGTYCTITANIGLGPWECLSMGLSFHVPFSYGIVHSTVGLIILALDLVLGEKIGLGTVLDALLVGNFVDLFDVMGFMPKLQALLPRVGLFVLGLLVLALGQAIYMSAGLGCGPRDTLMVGLGRRMKHVRIGLVETAILLTVLLVGWLLGGPVGIGTLIAGLGSGAAMQLVFSLLRFEPRSVHHESLIDTWRTIVQYAGGRGRTGT